MIYTAISEFSSCSIYNTHRQTFEPALSQLLHFNSGAPSTICFLSPYTWQLLHSNSGAPSTGYFLSPYTWQLLHSNSGAPSTSYFLSPYTWLGQPSILSDFRKGWRFVNKHDIDRSICNLRPSMLYSCCSSTWSTAALDWQHRSVGLTTPQRWTDITTVLDWQHRSVRVTTTKCWTDITTELNWQHRSAGPTRAVMAKRHHWPSWPHIITGRHGHASSLAVMATHYHWPSWPRVITSRHGHTLALAVMATH